MYFEYEHKHGWITIPEYYNNVYVKAFQKTEKAKRVWTEEEIKNLIQTNDTVLYRALLKLYSYQTATEQEYGETTNKNGVGFNSFDAEFLTSVSEFLKRRSYLTDKQKAAVRKRLKKYNRQLTAIANA